MNSPFPSAINLLLPLTGEQWAIEGGTFASGIWSSQLFRPKVDLINLLADLKEISFGIDIETHILGKTVNIELTDWLQNSFKWSQIVDIQLLLSSIFQKIIGSIS